MEKETLKKLKNYPRLKKYAIHFEKTDGDSEIDGFLPFIVIWFRDLFKEAGINDGQVPIEFEMDEETSEEFWSWGHNSRYANVFSWYLLSNLDFCIDIALQIIDNDERLSGFDADIEKRVKKEKKEEEKAFKKFMERGNK